MIDAKTAVATARQHAAEMIGPGLFPLEEIERTIYKGSDVWEITLSVPKEHSATSAQTPMAIALLGNNLRIAYKRFLIDAETGNLVAIKIRESETK